MWGHNYWLNTLILRLQTNFKGNHNSHNTSRIVLSLNAICQWVKAISVRLWPSMIWQINHKIFGRNVLKACLSNTLAVIELSRRAEEARLDKVQRKVPWSISAEIAISVCRRWVGFRNQQRIWGSMVVEGTELQVFSRFSTAVVVQKIGDYLPLGKRHQNYPGCIFDK